MHSSLHMEIVSLIPMLFPCCMFPCFAILGLLGLALWIWMLIEAATCEPAEGNDRIVWLLLVIFAGVVGALIYLLVRRPERKRKYGR